MDISVIETLLDFEDFNISQIEVDAQNRHLHVYLQWKTAFCDCRQCGDLLSAELAKAEQRLQPVRHLDCFDYKTLLYFDTHEMSCKSCGAMFNRKSLFMGENRFTTRALMEDWMVKVRDASPKKVAEWSGESERSFTSMYYRELRRREETRVLPMIHVLGMDEIQLYSGHQYGLVLYDIERHDVIDVLPNRKKDTIIEYLKEHQDGIFSELKMVCMDMCEYFREAVRAVFPALDIAADRFHVERQLCESLDGRRRELQSKIKNRAERRRWKKEYRFALLRCEQTQRSDPEASELLDEALDQDVELSRLHRLKEDFRDVYFMSDTNSALGALNKWIRRATYLGSSHLESFIGTVKNWKFEILQYVETGLTNGVAEGFNCKIKLVKRMGFGFRNFANFRLRILHTCGQTLK